MGEPFVFVHPYDFAAVFLNRELLCTTLPSKRISILKSVRIVSTMMLFDDNNVS